MKNKKSIKRVKKFRKKFKRLKKLLIRKGIWNKLDSFYEYAHLNNDLVSWMK